MSPGGTGATKASAQCRTIATSRFAAADPPQSSSGAQHGRTNIHHCSRYNRHIPSCAALPAINERKQFGDFVKSLLIIDADDFS